MTRIKVASSSFRSLIDLRNAIVLVKMSSGQMRRRMSRLMLDWSLPSILRSLETMLSNLLVAAS